MLKGIYKIKIVDVVYVGQDSKLRENKRLKDHLGLLRRDKHPNIKLQKAYSTYGEKSLEYEILDGSSSHSRKDLDMLEKYYIESENSFNSTHGCNRTMGGRGGTLGYKYSKEVKELKSKLIQGEKNPQSKISNKEFYEIVEMLKEGKTNEDIAKVYGLHSRYISLIRHKKRFTSLWENVEDYEPQISRGSKNKRKLNYEAFLVAVKMLESGATNVSVEKKFNLSSGAGSRIKHRKIYKDLWVKYDAQMERPTTIEN